jgi:hypothetical protein
LLLLLGLASSLLLAATCRPAFLLLLLLPFPS